jgi:hypothetical protein
MDVTKATRRTDAARLSRPVATPADVDALGDHERHRLAAWLAECTPGETPRRERRERDLLLVALSVGAVLLVPWVVFLAMSLPRDYSTTHWRATWVGLDGALIVALATTAWLGWRGRQLVATAMIVTATLLLSDAWFDITLSHGTGDRVVSALTAGLVEIPTAVLLIAFASRLIRALAHRVWVLQGNDGPPPPVYRLPILCR